MFADRVIVEVVGQAGQAQIHTMALETPQTLCDVHNNLWKRVGRKPAICSLAARTARVTFQTGRRVTDTLDCLEDLVKLALEEVTL